MATPRTDSETLNELKLARDKLIDAIVDGVDFIELTIRGKTSKRPVSTDQLDTLEALILRYDKKVSAESSKSKGGARNKIRMGKA